VAASKTRNGAANVKIWRSLNGTAEKRGGINGVAKGGIHRRRRYAMAYRQQRKRKKMKQIAMAAHGEMARSMNIAGEARKYRRKIEGGAAWHNRQRSGISIMRRIISENISSNKRRENQRVNGSKSAQRKQRRYRQAYQHVPANTRHAQRNGMA